MPIRLLTPLSQVRVLHGALVSFLRKETTVQLTPGVERSAAGRFAFLALLRKGFRELGGLPRRLCFERLLLGFERNPHGSLRTPESRSKTLGISD